MDTRPALTIGHSPDPDDVFMWWPITGMLDPAEPARITRPPALETGRFRYVGEPADISVLNRRAAESADLEITALSMFTYASVADRYALTACGASVGYGYGPKLVVRADSRLTAENALELLTGPGGRRVAIPGTGTTAFLVFSLMVRRPVAVLELPFDRIVDAVVRGDADAGLLIHQSQLTFEETGLREVADVGAWWREATGLPLPLGGNAIRRDLDDLHGPGTVAKVAGTLDRSIRYALEHREESLAYAMAWAPELDRRRAEQYIEMYVNDLTVDAGEVGREAVQRLLTEGHRRGLCPDPGRVEFIRPAAAGGAAG